MTTQIVVHILPHEIDWFQHQMSTLKDGSTLITGNDTILIDATLNLNLVDWNNSKLKKEFFINKFSEIENKIDWCETSFNVSLSNECLGCNDKRRQSILDSTNDNIIYLDTDLVFLPETLPYLLNGAKTVKNEYYIISPQLPRMWDSSWDVLVNSRFLNTPASHEGYINSNPFNVPIDEVTIRPIDVFKFGGGWFNLFSTNLLKKIGIPESLGPYGLDDTFIMYGADMLKQHGYDIQQYVLDGVLVKEDLPHTSEYTTKLYTIDKQAEYRNNSHKSFKSEINKFYNLIRK